MAHLGYTKCLKNFKIIKKRHAEIWNYLHKKLTQTIVQNKYGTATYKITSETVRAQTDEKNIRNPKPTKKKGFLLQKLTD